MSPNFLALLQALDRHRVQYVLVGGVAAIIGGAPINTIDLDIVYEVGTQNIERLGAALVEVDATYRDPAGRVIRPTLERLQANRTNLLKTRAAAFDAMQEIAPGWRFPEVLVRSRAMEIEGLLVRVLDLAAIVESKEAANRDKDRAQLPVLRRTLELSRRRREAG